MTGVQTCALPISAPPDGNIQVARLNKNLFGQRGHLAKVGGYGGSELRVGLAGKCGSKLAHDLVRHWRPTRRLSSRNRLQPRVNLHGKFVGIAQYQNLKKKLGRNEPMQFVQAV